MIELILALSLVCCGLLVCWLIDEEWKELDERRQVIWGKIDIDGKLNRMWAKQRRKDARNDLLRLAVQFGGPHPASIRSYPSAFGRTLHGGPYDD